MQKEKCEKVSFKQCCSVCVNTGLRTVSDQIIMRAIHHSLLFVAAPMALLLAGCVIPGAPYNGTLPAGAVVPGSVARGSAPPPPVMQPVLPYPYSYAPPQIIVAPSYYNGWGNGYWYGNRFWPYRPNCGFWNGRYYNGYRWNGKQGGYGYGKGYGGAFWR